MSSEDFNDPFRRAKKQRWKKCGKCGVRHAPQAPHKLSSILYRVGFKKEWGREPTWHDAMRHCPQSVKDKWTVGLMAKGVLLGSDPAKAGVKTIIGQVTELMDRLERASELGLLSARDLAVAADLTNQLGQTQTVAEAEVIARKLLNWFEGRQDLPETPRHRPTPN